MIKSQKDAVKYQHNTNFRSTKQPYQGPDSTNICVMTETPSIPTAPTLEEGLAALRLPQTQQLTPPPSIGTICGTKTLYEGPKRCDCCINWVEQYPEHIKESNEETSDAKRYAILCRIQKAHEDSTKPLELHSIIIQSPLLKSILGVISTGYPGITTTLEKVKFRAPFWGLFHRWQALAETEADQEDEALEHVRLLLSTLNSHLGGVRSHAHDLVENNVITYDYLWVLFAPNSLVYSRDEDCLLEVKRTEYYEWIFFKKTYRLHCRYVEWDGANFCWKNKLLEIADFSGTTSIRDLKVYPITHHEAPDDTQSKLLERGRKFASICGCHHKTYDGIIKVSGKSLFGSDSLRINERIIVDAKAFSEHTRPPDDESPSHRKRSYLRIESELEPLIEDLSNNIFMLCSPTVKAYALRTKCWGEVCVDGVSDIEWNEDAFRDLVLDKETKQLVESFVVTQTNQSPSPEFDDIVEGKGQGMIMMLTGEPGVGKTLTAETVAEKACRPLYMANAGELGTYSEDVEHGLAKIFDLAYRWNAVLVLDECDVFLEERTSENLGRNQLVSVFLRMLEYYRGIMFLTTNRASVIDTAFQSRIHLTLHYGGLDQDSRRKIWQALLKHAQTSVGFSEEDITTLSEKPINGRQIKNAVKSAKLLATADNAALNVGHVKTVLRVMTKGIEPQATTGGVGPKNEKYGITQLLQGVLGILGIRGGTKT
ncbi:P-loop containing nucleoside triphosphate hydrolase protein [Hypoxylon sp. NC1633]|nr:P-loop containing nucleoside triphosphate hydrolase protein [Hypoxylon sp. NC1633]